MGNQVRVTAVKQPTVNISQLMQHESNFVADAQGKNGDMGLGQITPIALADWNQMHPQEQYQHTPEHMFNPVINTRVTSWLANTRAPQQLRAYGLPDTLENRLAVYNGGIGTLRGKGITPQVQKYIDGYKNTQITGQPT